MPAELVHIPFTDAGIEMVKAGSGVMVLPQWMIRPYYEQQELLFTPITRKGCYRMQYINVASN
ncbi:hypothetical protein [Mucilaginibacter sp. CSA2-8R]|uniref:hypothetical protein n=1 Tax=Mucilaginibacter sp. CSA2-8R TaxID=3141542 RepID=UPI00315CAFC6